MLNNSEKKTKKYIVMITNDTAKDWTFCKNEKHEINDKIKAGGTLVFNFTDSIQISHYNWNHCDKIVLVANKSSDKKEFKVSTFSK